MQITFLILIATLIAAGIFTARARYTYAQDVASAAASEEVGDIDRADAATAKHTDSDTAVTLVQRPAPRRP